MGRLGLGLWSGPHVVGQLGSGPRVVKLLGSRVCRLADGDDERGKCHTPCKKGGETVREGNVREEYDRGRNVLHSA